MGLVQEAHNTCLHVGNCELDVKLTPLDSGQPWPSVVVASPSAGELHYQSRQGVPGSSKVMLLLQQKVASSPLGSTELSTSQV